jgi:hypothetical protein
METTKRIPLLLVLGSLLTGTTVLAQEQGVDAVSNTRTASCLLKIACDPSVLPLDMESLTALLYSTHVGGKATHEVLDVSPDKAGDFIVIENVRSVDAVPAEPAARDSQQPPSDGDEDAMMEEYMMMEEMMSRRSMRSRGAYEEHARGRRPERGKVSTGAPSPAPAAKRTVLLSLRIHLNQEVSPAAWEFMNALIKNLRDALGRAFEECRFNLRGQLELAVSRRDKARSQLSELMDEPELELVSITDTEFDPADERVYAVLGHETVDLSPLTPEMPFAEAIDILKDSVDPPLKIVVLWRDLLDNAEIEQTTPINMEGLAEIRLGTALDLLLKAVSDGSAELSYAVNNGVITIATVESLPRNLKTIVYEIPSFVHVAGSAGLSRIIRETIEPESWLDAGGKGTIKHLANKLAIRQTPEIHRKIQQFLKTVKTDVAVALPTEVPVEMLQRSRAEILREKQKLEMEIARLEARRSAIEEQMVRTTKEAREQVHSDPVTVELERIVELQMQQVQREKELVKEAAAHLNELADAEAKLARAKIELARRREELTKSAGGGQMAKFSDDLADMLIELYEKKAELQVVTSQLEEAETQLAAATTLEPDVLRVRRARQIFEIADRRASQLEALLAYLQPPTVTVVGAAEGKRPKF